MATYFRSAHSVICLPNVGPRHLLSSSAVPGAYTLSDFQHDLSDHLRLRPNVAIREALSRHLHCQQLVGLRSGHELDELDHGSAVILGPLFPRVGGESVAGESEVAVQVEVEGFIYRLMPVDDGNVLKAFLDGEVRFNSGIGGSVGLLV